MLIPERVNAFVTTRSIRKYVLMIKCIALIESVTGIETKRFEKIASRATCDVFDLVRLGSESLSDDV